LKDQDLHNLSVSPAQADEQATSSSSSTLGQQFDSDSERKIDSPNVSSIENCEDPASWPKRLSTDQRDFLIAKGLPKLDFNYEFHRYVVVKNLMQTSANFFEVYALKFSSFSLST